MTRFQAALVLVLGLAVMTAALTIMYGWWALFGGGAAYFVLGLLYFDFDKEE